MEVARLNVTKLGVVSKLDTYANKTFLKFGFWFVQSPYSPCPVLICTSKPMDTPWDVTGCWFCRAEWEALPYL